MFEEVSESIMALRNIIHNLITGSSKKREGTWTGGKTNPEKNADPGQSRDCKRETAEYVELDVEFPDVRE